MRSQVVMVLSSFKASSIENTILSKSLFRLDPVDVLCGAGVFGIIAALLFDTRLRFDPLCGVYIFKVSGSTFAVFVDYFRPTTRIASLAELNRVSYILTHDSIGVGEDGPTHQPVETVSGLRVFPNLDTFRPADVEETVAAYVHSVTREGGLTALILSYQNIDQNDDLDYMARREGALKGAYIAKKETADLDMIIIATGSEVQHALKVAADML